MIELHWFARQIECFLFERARKKSKHLGGALMSLVWDILQVQQKKISLEKEIGTS